MQYTSGRGRAPAAGFPGELLRQVKGQQARLCRRIGREIERRPSVESADFEHGQGSEGCGNAAQADELKRVDPARLELGVINFDRNPIRAEVGDPDFGSRGLSEASRETSRRKGL